MLLPTLRADLAMCETYAYRDEPPLACPISVHGGEHDDKVPLEHLTPWRVQTSGDFQLRVFPGNHFFYLKESRTAVMQALREELRRYTGGGGPCDRPRAAAHVEQVIAGVWREVLRVPHVGLGRQLLRSRRQFAADGAGIRQVARGHEHLVIGAGSVSVSDDPLAGGCDGVERIGAAGSDVRGHGGQRLRKH